MQQDIEEIESWSAAEQAAFLTDPSSEITDQSIALLNSVFERQEELGCSDAEMQSRFCVGLRDDLQASTDVGEVFIEMSAQAQCGDGALASDEVAPAGTAGGAGTDTSATTTSLGSEPPETDGCGVYEGVVCEGFLTDEPGIVTDRLGVEAAVADVWDDHDVEFALVVVDHSREQVPNDFAVNLFNAWGVGDPEKSNGLVVLVSLDERRVEVAQGSNVEVSGELLADVARSFFQAEEWDPGLFAIVAAVDRELAAGTSR